MRKFPKSLLHKGKMLKSKARKIDLNRNYLIAVFVAIGVLTLGLSRAGLPTASFEAETSTLSGKVAKVDDQTAAGGKYIRFGSADKASIWVTPGGGEIAASNNITLRVIVDSFANKHETVQIHLVYDSTKLTYVSLDPSPSSYDIGGINDIGTGYLQIVRGSTTPLTGKKNFIDLTFKAKANSGSTTISFDAEKTHVVFAGTALPESNVGGTYTFTN